MTRCTLAFLWIITVLPGCAGLMPFRVQVNGFQSKDMPLPSQATYVVLPINVSEGDLAFQEYARMISKKMTERGFRQSDSQTADIAVFIAYGIDNGTTISSTSSVPIHGQTGGGMSTFQGMTSGGQIYSGTVMSPPSYGVIGSSTVTSDATSYKRMLRVDVVDYKRLLKDGTTVSFWKGEIDSVGASSNLRQVMPALVEAGFRNFGQNVSENVVLSQHDPSIEKLKEVK